MIDRYCAQCQEYEAVFGVGKGRDKVMLCWACFAEALRSAPRGEQPPRKADRGDAPPIRSTHDQERSG